MLGKDGNFIDYAHRPIFSSDYETQKKEILSSDIVKSFIEYKKKRREENCYFPNYHFANSYGGLNDPNGLCYWKGNWHLFYQQFSFGPNNSKTIYWGHAMTADLVKWVELPHAIYRSLEWECWSGATCVEENRVIAAFYGYGGEEGIYIAVSEDPFLLNWTKITEKPVLPKEVKTLAMPHCFIPEENGMQPYNVFDPCIWKQGNTYHLITGGVKRQELTGSQLRNDYHFTSEDLIHWQYLGNLTSDSCFTVLEDDGACPYFLPLGDKHMLLYYSHANGAKYLLGAYNGRDQFVPVNGGSMNSTSQRGGYCAPSGFPFENGDVCAVYVMHSDDGPDFISLPHRISMGGLRKDEIRISPAADFSEVRTFIGEEKEICLTANEEKVLSGISGNSMELELEYSKKDSSCFELRLLRSSDGKEYTSVCFYYRRGSGLVVGNEFPFKSIVSVDCANSSVSCHRVSAPETRQILLNDDDPLKLHIFIDKCVVEIFVNDSEAIGRFVYPDSASTAVSLISHGRDTVVDRITAYEIPDLNTELHEEIFK